MNWIKEKWKAFKEEIKELLEENPEWDLIKDEEDEDVKNNPIR